MAYFKKKKERVLMEEESEELLKIADKNKNQHRDYITLKSKMSRAKVENDQELLEYYTTEKFNEYFKTLTPIKATYNVQAQQQIKELYDLVQAGHNACVFGRGSKIQLLQTLHKKLLSQYHTFEVKGYLPSVTDKKIYTHFGGFLIDVQLVNKIEVISQYDQLELYENILKQYGGKIVVLLHSIDGPSLMTADIQQKLARLFDLPNIQVICSLDNIRMVMNWSPITLQKFKFLFFNIDTKQPYIQQLRYRPLKNESKQTTQQSILYIWESLNVNQKKIAKFIAENALKNIGLEEDEISHFTFNQLLDHCIDQIVLSSDNQLRQNLLELLDHNMIIERMDEKKNKKTYLMKYDKRILEKIIDLKIE